MRYTETADGLPLHYLDQGPRTPSAIFLIHGEPCSSAFWRRNILELSRHFRVVAMDVRGRGESGKTGDGHTIAQDARDFRHVLEALVLRHVHSGHLLHWTEPDKFNSEVLAFTREVLGRGSPSPPPRGA